MISKYFPRLNIFLALSIIGMAGQVAIAKTSVWEVFNGDNRLFLGGTVHVLSKEDYPLPCQFNVAFDRSDTLYLETDGDQLENPEFVAKLMLEGTYPLDVSVMDKLSSSVQNKLTMYFAESGLPGMAFVKFKPGMLLSTMAMVELQKMGVTVEGVDRHFEKRAQKSSKSVGYFETVDEQFDFILNLGDGNEDRFIEYLVESMSQFPTQFESLRSSWRSGDLISMSMVAHFELLEKEFPSIYEALIAKRNKSWLEKIELMLQDEPTEYVLVGGLHMVGEIGLIEMLKTRGYKINQLGEVCH